MEKCGKVRSSAEKCGEVRRSAEKCGGAEKSAEKCGEVRRSAEKRGELRRSAEKCGEMRRTAEEFWRSFQILVSMLQFCFWGSIPAPRVLETSNRSLGGALGTLGPLQSPEAPSGD